MELLVSHPLFQKKKLTVIKSSILKAPVLKLNGETQKVKSKKTYIIEGDDGLPVMVKLSHFIDPIPTIKINEEKVRLAPQMTWYEWMFLSIPLLLILTGGMLGGILGGVGTIINAHIFRSQLSVVGRYGCSIFITSLCYIIFFIISGLFLSYIFN